MRYVQAAGIRVSAIGVGTWQFGSRDWGYGDDYAQRTAIDIVRHALDLGVNLIDTAEIYGFGASERIVAEALDGRHDEAFVATKVFPVLPLAPVVAQRGRASAERLGHRPIDLYQVHWPNPVVPMSTTVAGLRTLRDEGTIVHAGVSNFSADRWHDAERAYGDALVSNQVQYSLVHRAPERDVLGYAQACDRVVIAYSPLAQGLLGGRYDAANPPAGAARRTNPLLWPENLERATPLIEALREVAAGADANCAQVALAWLLRRDNVVAIPGASSVEQLESNVAAAEIVLSDDEDAALTAASDAFHPQTGLEAAKGRLGALLGRS